MSDYDLVLIGRIESRCTIVDRGFSSPCWEYNGLLTKSGYGKIKFLGITYRVHRIYFKLKNLLIFKDHLLILHKCNNRKCFNLDHLYQGNNKDNSLDIIKAGNNHNINKTHCSKGHEFNEKNTSINSKGHRRCNKCHLDESTRAYVIKNI